MASQRDAFGSLIMFLGVSKRSPIFAIDLISTLHGTLQAPYLRIYPCAFFIVIINEQSIQSAEPSRRTARRATHEKERYFGT